MYTPYIFQLMSKRYGILFFLVSHKSVANVVYIAALTVELNIIAEVTNIFFIHRPCGGCVVVPAPTPQNPVVDARFGHQVFGAVVPLPMDSP
jgi:hypothetical protein